MQDFHQNPVPPGQPPMQPGDVPLLQDTGGVRVPLLISGIFNLIWAGLFLVLAPFTWCATLFLAPLVLALGIIELVFASKIGSSLRPWEHRGGALALGILEIIEVLFCLPNFILGIIVLANLKKLDPVV